MPDDSEFPEDLLQAQHDWYAARDALAAVHARLPQRTDPQPEQTLEDGTVVPASPGWTQEDWAERDGCMERWRQLGETIQRHPHWAGYDKGKVVAAQSRLKQLALPEDQRYTPPAKGR